MSEGNIYVGYWPMSISRGVSEISFGGIAASSPGGHSPPMGNGTSRPSGEDDDFDCVDIYKQPALNHPLLKDHEIQLFPNFSKNPIASSESYKGESTHKVYIHSKGCPSGMVPIERTKAKYGHQFSQQSPRLHFATLNTIPNTAVHGARATMNTWNPSVTSGQFSMGVIRIQSGPPAQLNIIQAGWAVHSDLYGDHKTHFTIRWTVDGFRRTGCYNARCPGFVQVHPTVRPGLPFRETSVFGAEQHIIDVQIIQDRNGNWWLVSEGNIYVGYWPKKIFTHLAQGVSEISFGGITASSPGGQSPAMVAGTLPSANYKKTGFFEDIKIAGPNGLVDLSNYKTYIFVSDYSCYNIIDFGNQHRDLGNTFAYGGHGGFRCL
ncbi:hypothetical protein FEM48_Zijuj11G0086600 [Ziziphus jujuba var. spinosa]|uniref:Neprosin PEP catalytic domain-containing protein n=1 Tax=Ziziphus jujuba var. spinosa TaxID=714518 RepID=A0A978UHX8_ZIZJJ|nr:hypothetical protein FEM48_Zijuj11G0086600 [Ziziphus jujuba var. spinosa]